MDIRIERDFSTWRVTAHTLRGRALLEGLEIPDGTHLGSASHLSLLEAAQQAGVEVGA
jgi:hypothetical protein